MKCNRIIAAAAFAAAAATAGAQSLPLNFYGTPRDTVTADHITIVAATAPGATATVNGKDVHVYRTGSFGTEVVLAPGANHIAVKVEKSGESATKDFNVFRTEPKAKPAPAGDPYADERTTALDHPVYIKTTPGAYLQWGNGDDRLGGSKMGFVDSDIPMVADGEKGSLYRVALAKGQFAYIPKEYTAPAAAVPPIVNTGSWSVTNTGKADRISIALPERLVYKYTTTPDPSTLTIDLFGATDNSNWITQRTLDLGMIADLWCEQPQSDVYRIVIRLKDKHCWGFSVGYEGNSLVINVRHAPEKLQLKGMTIGLDAGHGGIYSGAVSPSGIKEKDINLEIVLKLRDMLEAAGAKVVLTRDDDSGPSMTERKRIWREAGVQLAVSVHNNAGGSSLESPGTAALYKHSFDRPLAMAIARRLVALDVPLFGVVGNFNFSLNGPTDYPNMLVEGLFMSSLQEEELLSDPNFRTRMARAIFDGLNDYLKECAK